MARGESSRHARARQWWLAGIVALTLIGPAGAARAAEDPAVAVSASAPSGAVAAALDPAAAQVFELVNAERQRAGLPSVSPHPQLVQAAQAHAEHMAATGCAMSTCQPDVWERLKSAGYTGWTGAAALFGSRYATPQAWVSGVTQTFNATSNILSPEFTESGVGVAFGGPDGSYWVQLFAVRSSSQGAETETPPVGRDSPPAEIPAPPPIASARTAAQEAAVARVAELVNAERQQAGLPPLDLYPQLDRAAQAYSELMATTTCFSHNCPPEPDLLQRIELAGSVPWAGVGENIAAGQRTAEEVMAGWMASPGHRANILDPRYGALGVGLATDSRGRMYWTQEFGIPRR